MKTSAISKIFFGVEIQRKHLYPKKEREVKCPNCGFLPSSGHKFCAQCGRGSLMGGSPSPHYDQYDLEHQTFYNLCVIRLSNCMVKDGIGERFFLFSSEMCLFSSEMCLIDIYVTDMSPVIEAVSVKKFLSDIEAARNEIIAKLPKEIWEEVKDTFRFYNILILSQ